jgi:hypothetical protein
MDARNDLINNNSSIWRELKEWLLEISHGKCWFSEAKDCFSHWDVEHYRPKKSSNDERCSTYHGYWWLAFDWRNLRICGNVGNRKKSSFFPLREGCARAGGPQGELRREQPLLLDPADDDDPNLLFFNLMGEAIPAPHVNDLWEQTRVTYSVERCKLDYPPLADRRKAVWGECWSQIQAYLDELAKYQADPSNAIAKECFKAAARRIRSLIREEKEFSSVARACILSSGDQRVISLLQS